MVTTYFFAKEYPGFPDLDIYKCPFSDFANTFEKHKNLEIRYFSLSTFLNILNYKDL